MSLGRQVAGSFCDRPIFPGVLTALEAGLLPGGASGGSQGQGQACLQPASCCFSSKATDWLEILQSLLFSPCTELQHRGMVVVRNMMAADREVAMKLMESEMLEILSVATRAEDKPQVAQLAQECLAHAVSYGLIKPNAAAGE